MGLQSTFFGVNKYIVLPEHLKRDELIAYNDVIEPRPFVNFNWDACGWSHGSEYDWIRCFVQLLGPIYTDKMAV